MVNVIHITVEVVQSVLLVVMFVALYRLNRIMKDWGKHG